MSYVFDLGNPATNANPFPEFARLCVEDPVHWSPAMKAWIVTRYADVKQVALNNQQISADRLTDPKTGNPYYTALVRVDEKELAALPNIQLYPGMPAQVMIPTTERTAFQYIVGPLVMSFNQAFRQK